MRLRDAVKLPFLIALYALTVTLAFLVESKGARRFWRALLLPLAGLAILFLVVVQIPCEHGVADPITRPMPQACPAVDNLGLPFYDHVTPVREVGDVFDYQIHAGYQVPISFEFGSHVDWGRIISARLALKARLRTPSEQIRGTEAIWVDGVLSGTPFDEFVNHSNVRFDLTASNHTFFERIDDCCRRRIGWTELSLDELLEGSRVTPERLLADGRLEIVISDDTEIFAAELEVCSRLSLVTHCRTAWVTPGASYTQLRTLPTR